MSVDNHFSYGKSGSLLRTLGPGVIDSQTFRLKLGSLAFALIVDLSEVPAGHELRVVVVTVQGSPQIPFDQAPILDCHVVTCQRLRSTDQQCLPPGHIQ
jgi:hypothetical protein